MGGLAALALYDSASSPLLVVIVKWSNGHSSHREATVVPQLDQKMEALS